MSQFNETDPKYRTCCCGAHITMLARVFIIIDLIVVLVTGTFLLIIPALIVGLGLYGVFKQSRVPLLIYVVLGMISTVISILVAIIILTGDHLKSTVTDLDGNKIRREAPTEVLLLAGVFCVIGISLKIYFNQVYWKMATFLKDREMGVIPLV